MSITNIISLFAGIAFFLFGMSSMGGGLKRISGSGDIDLAGTGILLVDEIELSESSKFSLYPYGTIYSSGSVAVFLKEAGTENSYRMINGASVEGVLDERYVIPAGIKLIVPANAVLRLETVMAVFREDEGGEQDETPEYYTAQDKIKDPDTIDQARTVITAGNLTIPENTSLVIETFSDFFVILSISSI